MLDFLASVFRSSSPGTAPEEPSEQIALGALLVEAARKDERYDQSEKAAIARILAAEFGLDPAAAQTLRTRAEAAQESAVGLFRFTNALKQSVPFEERARIVEYLWEVALADGERDAAEDGLVRSVCGLLGVPDQESALARQRVDARMGR